MANIFPKWSNWLPFKILFCLIVLGGGVSAGVWYYLNPEYMRVGYQPAQPVPFSHKIHSGQLGIFAFAITACSAHISAHLGAEKPVCAHTGIKVCAA